MSQYNNNNNNNTDLLNILSDQVHEELGLQSAKLELIESVVQNESIKVEENLFLKWYTSKTNLSMSLKNSEILNKMNKLCLVQLKVIL